MTNSVDELLRLIDAIQDRSKPTDVEGHGIGIPPSESEWETIAGLDAIISIAVDQAFPNIPQATGQTFGFCRIPIIETLGGTFLKTSRGYNSAKNWRSAMAILRATIEANTATTGETTTKPARTEARQPGHSKNKIPPEDVQEIIRMMKLKRWQHKPAIEVCRAYIRGKYKNAGDEFIETQAQSLNRKRNRY